MASAFQAFPSCVDFILSSDLWVRHLTVCEGAWRTAVCEVISEFVSMLHMIADIDLMNAVDSSMIDPWPPICTGSPHDRVSQASLRQCDLGLNGWQSAQL